MRWMSSENPYFAKKFPHHFSKWFICLHVIDFCPQANIYLRFHSLCGFGFNSTPTKNNKQWTMFHWQTMNNMPFDMWTSKSVYIWVWWELNLHLLNSFLFWLGIAIWMRLWLYVLYAEKLDCTIELKNILYHLLMSSAKNVFLAETKKKYTQ